MHLQFKINKPIDQVFLCLSIAKNFELVHPVIYKIDFQSSENHLVHEQLSLAFIKYNFTYPCSITSNIANKTVLMKAVVKKIVHVEIQFKLTEQNGYTIVNETIYFKTILPISFILKQIFKTQHLKLFSNIDKLESNKLKQA